MFSKHAYVYEVYKQKSFTKAAEKLFISQPSLSAAIKKIEKSLGIPLFDRSSSQIKLTDAGREYISAVEKIMSIESDFTNRLNDISNLETGHISVGGSNYLSSYILPKIVTEFSKRYPKINVTLVESNSTGLCEMIAKEELDIVIDSFDESMSTYDGEILAKERLLLCVPAGFAINNKLKEYQIYPDDIYNNTVDIKSVPPVPINKFKSEKFILLKSGNDMHKRAMDIFRKSKINPTVLFSVDQLNISYLLVDSGMGLCFATDTLFKYGKFHKNVILYNVSKEHSTRTLYIAHKRNRYCTNAMTKFIEVAKEVINK